MLGKLYTPEFQWRWTQMYLPHLTPGTSVIPGASNTYGSWTQLATSSDVSYHVYGFHLIIHSGGTSTVAKQHMVDIGYDPAGGTSYTTLVDGLACGNSATFITGGQSFYFPLFIPAGSSIAVRVKGGAATALTVFVGISLYGKQYNPEMAQVGTKCTSMGFTSGTSGTSVTPGTSGAEGSWVSLGSVTRQCWYWVLGVQCNAGTITALSYNFDVAYGDGSNYKIFMNNVRLYATATENITRYHVPDAEGYCTVPANTNLYVRGSCSASPVAGWNVTLHGVS